MLGVGREDTQRLDSKVEASTVGKLSNVGVERNELGVSDVGGELNE